MGKIRAKEILKDYEVNLDLQLSRNNDSKRIEKILDILFHISQLKLQLDIQTKLITMAENMNIIYKKQEHKERAKEIKSEILIYIQNLKFNKRQFIKTIQQIYIIINQLKKSVYEIEIIQQYFRIPI